MISYQGLVRTFPGLAEKIGSGGRVVVKHKGRLNDTFKQELRSLK
ncbi:hypothetical protein [Citrobacter sp. AATXQ]|nr:hypothetical protein [Citrobacter sp. AATXQ]